jgi:hypothetical protein
MTSYEIRRGAAVIATKPDADVALSFATLHAHFPGQLKVFAVTREEREITQSPAEPATGTVRTLRPQRAS